MNNKIKILSIAAVAIALIGVAQYSLKEETPKKTVVIRILDSPSTLNDWEIVKKLTGRDLFEEKGIKLELITNVQEGGTNSLQALVANNIDVGGSATPAWINLITNGGKIKALAASQIITPDTPGSMVVLENSSIYTIKDLAGKKIAVNVLGADADYLLRVLLKRNGLSIDKVQLIVVPYENHEQMLRSGQVDAAMWGQSGGIRYYQKAFEKGGVRAIPGTTNAEIKGTNASHASFIGFREDFIQKYPDVVRRFVDVYAASNRIVWEEYQKDPDRVKKAVAEIYEEKGGNPKLAKYFILKWLPISPLITDDDIQWWIDRYIEDGILKPGQLKPSDIYTNEFNPYYKK